MALLVFGSVAVGMMLVMYALEEHAHWFVLGFSAASASAALYGVLIEAWPFAAIEAIWAMVALHRWYRRATNERDVAHQTEDLYHKTSRQ